MPVRKIPKNYRNVTGIAAHAKADGPAMFESTLERDFITLLEFAPTISSFEVQPLTIMWNDANGTQRSYTPDILVSYSQPSSHDKVLFEVKYRDELRKDWLDLHPKFRATVHFARAQGWRFKIVTEVEIRTPYLDNARFLLPFLHQNKPAPADIDLLISRLRKFRNCPLTDLLNDLSADRWEQARLLPSLWHLIASRSIAADLDQKLNMGSQIWSIEP